MSRRFLVLMLLASLFLASFSTAFNQTVLVNFIHSSQLPNGSFGSWSPYTSAVVAGLYSVEGNSSNVSSALTWLRFDLLDANSFTWGESDAVGIGLFAFENQTLAERTALEQNLSGFQLSSGGFKGWYSNGDIVEDSVDTAWAVLGHNSLNVSQKQNAVNYLISLQNSDGSFNHSSAVSSSSFSSLGPDLTSSTSLSLLALNKLGIGFGNQSVVSGLNFLKASSSSCFEGSFSASLSALAFNAFNEVNYSAAALNYLKTLQNSSSGGFADSHRFSANANALDSGFALLALSLNQSSNASCSPLNTSVSLTPGVSTPVINGSQVVISLNVSRPVENAVFVNLTYPNSSVVSLPLSNSSATSYSVLFNGTAALGNYSLLFAVNSFNTSYAKTSWFVSSAPVQVAVLASLPNSTTYSSCVIVANGSSGEQAFKQAFSSEWAAFSFGDFLSKVLDVGCPASNPFCQSSCNLYWNFYALNGSWYSPSVGLSDFMVENASVLGVVWSSNFSRSPPSVNFSAVCTFPSSSLTLASESDLLVCPIAPSPTSVPSPAAGGSSQSFSVALDFPSGKQDLSSTKNIGACSKA